MITVIPKNVYKVGAITYSTGGMSVHNGVAQRNHIHGLRVKTITTEVTYTPNDKDVKPHTFTKEYSLFRLDDGTEFMEYENNKWHYFTGCWPESPQCCQDAKAKYIIDNAIEL